MAQHNDQTLLMMKKLSRMKKQHNVRQLEICGKNLSADAAFKTKF